MTPRERAEALAKGQPVDRMPLGLFFGAPAHTLLGWTLQQETESGRNMAAVQKKVYETFGSDGVSIDYGLHTMAEALGAEITRDPHISKSILRYPFHDFSELSALDLSDLTVEKESAAGKCFDAVRILQDELGQEVNCSMGFPGPFTAASGLVGPEVLLRGLARQPEQVHELMNFVTEALLQLAEPFLRQEVPVGIADPLASCTVISRKNFQIFVKPYHRRLAERFKKIRPFGVSCHICGNTEPILSDMADCGFDTISIDNQVDLKLAKNEIGGRVQLMGNVDPVAVLLQGTPDQVRQAVRRCYAAGWDSPKGYLLALGCDAAFGTPLENVFAFMDEGRKCARYPVSPENFAEWTERERV